MNKRRPWINVFDVDIGVYALVAARVGLSPGQFADFITGWFGIDLADDDDAEEVSAGSMAVPAARRPGS